MKVTGLPPLQDPRTGWKTLEICYNSYLLTHASSSFSAMNKTYVVGFCGEVCVYIQRKTILNNTWDINKVYL